MVQALATPILAIGVTLLIGQASINDLAPGRAAVRVNNLTGTQETITTPGFVLDLPIVHSVYKADAAPLTFIMKGDEDMDMLNVRALTVRANDGSNFHFGEFTVVFQLDSAHVIDALRDGGVDDGFQRWLKPYARSILRSEFGRESTIDISNPGTYTGAAQRAKDRLNALLEPHGVTVTQIVTPRPKFNPEYESAIERRNSLGNELEVIKSNLARAHTERQRRLAEVNQEQNRSIQERRAQLEAELAQALAVQAAAKREADTYRITKIGEGQAALSGAHQSALELKGRLSAELEAKRAEIEAFRQQPVERVMQRLSKQLEGVTVKIEPYAQDASPQSIRLLNQP